MTQVFHLYRKHETEDVAPRWLPSPDPLPSEVTTSHGRFRIEHRVLSHGLSAGVEVLTVRGEEVEVSILPTRGMGIWRAASGGVTYGWKSPVRGPVNPAFVPLHEPSGLGWLSGFDELLVRCGLESNGAPEFDDENKLRYPLHGHIANTPAESLSVAVDRDSGVLEVRGIVRESRLFFKNWVLATTIRLHANADWIEIDDSVTNDTDRANDHQLLYHINIGAPVLSEGARLVVPAEEVVAKTAVAVEGLDSYDVYGKPQPGFSEQVYLMKPACDSEGWSQVVLKDSAGQCGCGVRFDTNTLPYFIQWKNTGGERDGYVTGLEPATNFPNCHSFERQFGRVVTVQPHETVDYRVRLFLLASPDRVTAFEHETLGLSKGQPRLVATSRPEWCQ